MLTRLKVDGFKNLVGVDVRFGPFTCIAGANGVGKSNLFDAIRFLAALADNRLVEAAKLVREGRTADVRSLFHRVGDSYRKEMTFEAEMIIPREGVDDLGQRAVAGTTFLHYKLVIAHRDTNNDPSSDPLEIKSEELIHITQGEAKERLGFPNKKIWRESAIVGKRVSSLISTEKKDAGGDGAPRVEIKFHQDRPTKDRKGTGGGRPASFLASTLPRTVLSVANAAENRTATLARREMQSWRLLQLEPSALREPDLFTDPNRLGSDGSHLAATLYRLARARSGPPGHESFDEARVFAQVANRLAELIDDVLEVRVESDSQRELRTLQVMGIDKTWHQARALSDGTLRFLALAVIDLDPSSQGVLCLEEPENGLHPNRIPAMLSLLQDITTDTDEPVNEDNPLRQVIVNTHSPAVVGGVPDDSLLVARLREQIVDGRRFRSVQFACLDQTWRGGPDVGVDNIAKGDIGAYLNPIAREIDGSTSDGLLVKAPPRPARRRVVDRPDLRAFLPGFEHET